MRNTKEIILQKFRKKHNLIFGLLFIGIFLSHIYFSQKENEYISSILSSLFSVLLLLDFVLIIVLLVFVAKNSKERFQVAELAAPIQLSFALIIIIYVINVFSENYLYPPFSLHLMFLCILPLGYLWWIESVFWKPQKNIDKTEGERKVQLTNLFVATSGVIAFGLILYFSRIIVIEKNSNGLLIVLVNLPTFLMSIYFWVKVDWLEKEFNREIIFKFIVVSIFNSSLYFLSYFFYDTLFVEVPTRVAIFIIAYYIFTISGCIIIFNNLNSIKTFIWLSISSFPLLLIGLLRFINFEKISIRTESKQLYSILLDGFIWALGALLGSVLFSFIVMLNKKRNKIQVTKPHINDADLKQLTDTTSISFKIANDLINNKPYGSKKDVLEKVKGIGEKRLGYLIDRFQI